MPNEFQSCRFAFEINLLPSFDIHKVSVRRLVTDSNAALPKVCAATQKYGTQCSSRNGRFWFLARVAA
jgi:hypothetical protein